MFIDSCLTCAKISWHQEVICPACFTQFISWTPYIRGQSQLQVLSPFIYSGTIKDLILRCKAGRAPKVSRRTAEIMARVFVAHTSCEVAGIIPIPGSGRIRRDHGYLLAEGLSEALRAPVLDGHLAVVPQLKTQKEKSLDERLEDRFVCRKPLPSNPGGVWLLVDDVITTGATLVGAHKTLGSPAAVCLTLATRPFDLLNRFPQ